MNEEQYNTRVSALKVKVEEVTLRLAETLKGETLEVGANSLIKVLGAVVSEIPNNDDLKAMMDHIRNVLITAASFAHQRNDALEKGTLAANDEVGLQ